MIGPLTRRQQARAELAYSDAVQDPYFNDGEPYLDRFRAMLAARGEVNLQAADMILVAPDEAVDLAWVAVGIERAHRWDDADLRTSSPS